MHPQSGRSRGRGRGSFDQDRGSKPGPKKGYLDENTMMYYRRVSDTLNELHEKSDDEKGIFLNNAVSNLGQEILQVSQNQTVSSIIESLIRVAAPCNLRVLFVAMVSDPSVPFLDRFASHVFETLLQRLSFFYCRPTKSSSDEDEDDVAQEIFLESFESMQQFVDSNFETLTTDSYGSHVLRALLEGLSNVPVVHELKRSQRSGYHSHFKGKENLTPVTAAKAPDELRSLYSKYADKVFQTCDDESHLKDPMYSLLLQAVLMMWKQTDLALCHKHCRRILDAIKRDCVASRNDSQDGHRLPDLACDPVGSHLLEVIFRLASNDILQDLFEAVFKHKLLYFAIHPVANFVLQKLISAISVESLMEEVFEEMLKVLEDILASGHMGLVTCLAEAAHRLALKQEEFVTVLMEAFHCKEPEGRQQTLAKLLLSLTTYEVFFKLEEEEGGKEKAIKEDQDAKLAGPINHHGSLLMQKLLQLTNPRHSSKSLVALRPEELQLVFSDPAGSHVIDAFFSSSTVLDMHKENMLKKMKGHLVEVACNKNGSRCLESVWKSLSVKQRTRLAQELAESDRLRNDRFGHFLFRNFGLLSFNTDHKAWLEKQGAESKRKRMMKEILHGADPPSKRSKKEKYGVFEAVAEEEEDSVTAKFLKLKEQSNAGVVKKENKYIPDDQDTSAPEIPTEKSEVSKKKKKKKREKDVSATQESTEDDSSRAIEQSTDETLKKKKKKKKQDLLAENSTSDNEVRKKKKDKSKVKVAESGSSSEVAEEGIELKAESVKEKSKKKKRGGFFFKEKLKKNKRVG